MIGLHFILCRNLYVTATDIPDLSNAVGLDYSFSGCESLYTIPNIENWDVSNITKMIATFWSATNFNQDLSTWNTSACTDMGGMFNYATSFNQDISGWDVSNVISMVSMFTSSGFSTENYEKLLVGWSSQNVQNDVDFDAGPAQYHSEYADEKSILTGKGWSISDGGMII